MASERGTPQAGFLDIILTRRSVREFQSDPIPVELLQKVMQAAQAAPYGTANDEREFVVLGGKAKDELVAFVAERLDAILPVLGDAPAKTVLKYARGLMNAIGQAPVIVAVFALVSDEGHTLALPSAAVAVENLLLAAWSLGLGGCYTTGGVYLADSIAEYLNLPGRQLIALVPLGNPLRLPSMKPRPEDAVIWRGFPEMAGREQARALPPEDDAQVDVAAAHPTGETPWMVLIVDVATQATKRTATVLRRAGYSVQQCARPSEALAAIATHQPDVVIVDALLPEMSGYDLCRQIRQVVTGYLPVIVTTTAYNAADVASGLVSGADAVQLKPVSSYELLAALQALLRSKALYAELEAANERLRELEGLRDDLTHMMVHDLRTPLTSILGALDLLSRNEGDADVRHEMLSMAADASSTMMGLINNLLDVAKMEDGTPDLDLTAVSLGEIMAQVRDLTAGAALERGLSLEMVLPDPPIKVRADADFLRRALTNLVGNALKLTFEGEARVWAEAGAESGYIALRVRDTGPGIPPEALTQIFEKFGQVERTAGAPHVGTGLGLTFVRMAVEAMGGRVEVESEVGHGSTFTLYLPPATGES